MNFVTARFNDEEAKWIYKFGDIAPIYLKSWFTIDFVRARDATTSNLLSFGVDISMVCMMAGLNSSI